MSFVRRSLYLLSRLLRPCMILRPRKRLLQRTLSARPWKEPSTFSFGWSLSFSRTRSCLCGACGGNKRYLEIRLMPSRWWKQFPCSFSSQDSPFKRYLQDWNSTTTVWSSHWNDLAIDEHLVWRSGITVPDAPNHYVQTYNSVRIQLLRLLIVVLSQPLFYGPDEYLLILNPFSTYFTSRRAKNTKNLFVSLVNTILAYDT